jgi:hypothetical protein
VCHTDAIQFLKDVGLSAQRTFDMKLMPRLLEVPHHTRAKYGKRKPDMSKEEKELQARERNRVHAQATRVRRAMLRKVIEDYELLPLAPDQAAVIAKYMADIK